MDDLELCETAAKWLGINYEIIGYRKPFIAIVGEYVKGNKPVHFDPLTNWNDLMLKVVPKLPKGTRMVIGKGDFIVGHIMKRGTVRGKFPDDFPRAVLELVKENADDSK
jgi:hypothetical protein